MLCLNPWGGNYKHIQNLPTWDSLFGSITGTIFALKKKIRAIWTYRPFWAHRPKLPGARAVASIAPGATTGTFGL